MSANRPRIPDTKRTRRGRWLARAALALLFFACAASAADEYPNRPLKLLVGFSAGGGLDISCRHWAQRLTARLGQPVIVENRPGASGELAVKQAMASKPDGYTLLCLSNSNTISSSKPNPPFDVRTDVIPVVQMTRFTYALYVNPALPVKSVAELIAYAKARPGQLNYASVGAGSTPHLAFEVLKLNTGMDIVHVPFKGTAQTASAVMAGDIQVGLDAIAAVKSHFESGRLRPLAVISAERTPPMPTLPGMREAGVTGVDIISYTGVAVPAKTPKPIIEILNRNLNGILQEPETATIFAAQGYEIGGGTPEDFLRVISDDAATWSRVIRVADIKLE
jgi:tripartite-type tricarboxylate transporter receptor subunit TctC